jgi:hypothetical protein
VHPDPLRLAFGLPVLAAVLEVADELLLLRVDADGRMSVGELL